MKLSLILAFIFIAMVLQGQGIYTVYFGNLHSHTGFSDGEQTPADAYTYARDVAGIDFLAVTDHMEQVSGDELLQTQQAAAAATQPGGFVGIAGYEWGSPYYGHCNVFNANEMPAVSSYLNWSSFREWLIERPYAFAQFNHPGDEDYFNNWYDFEYKGEATDASFPLIEFQNIQQANDWYELALNNGWHLSPVWNQDNHSADWGTKNDGRAGLWCTELSLNSMFDAILAGRTFASMDKNAMVWLESGLNHMGSTIQRYGNMPFHIVLNDSDNENWSSIEFRSDNGLLVSFASPAEVDTTILMTLYTDKYVYIRAIQEDGDYVWSAPVYLSGVITGISDAMQIKIPVYTVLNRDNTMVIHSTQVVENAQIQLIDVSGRVHFSSCISLCADKDFTFGVANLQDGVYIVTITHPSHTLITKILIQR